MFKINQPVKVKPNMMDPDTGRYDISGWQGWVVKIEELKDRAFTLLIAWDSQTLQSMPEPFVEESVRDGYLFAEMYLSAEDLEAAEPRDDPRYRLKIVELLEYAHRWAELEEQGKRIRTVEDDCEADYFIMDCWFEYLENNLEIPCPATYVGDSNRHLRHGAEVTVNGFVDADDLYGVIGSVIYKRRWMEVPLCDVKPKESTKSTQALEDYVIWFANQ